MKRQSIISLAAISGCVFLFACGDDVTKVTNVTNEVSGMEVVASADSLGKCDSTNVGKTVYASDENAAYVCADSGWTPLSQKASDGKDGTYCLAEILSDSSGYKIVCGEDSVGVIKNGVEGNGCTLADNGDGTVTQVCGKDTVSLYKAFCGGTAYDPAKAYCIEDTVYSYEEKPYDPASKFCGGTAYDPAKAYCFENALYSCGEKPYDPASKFCVEETLYDLCNGMTYDPAAWQCGNGKIVMQFTDSRDGKSYKAVKIGTQAWMAENLNYAYTQTTADLDSSSFCYDNDPAYCETYGRLYLWSAAMDSAAVFSEDGKNCGYEVTCSVNGNVQGVCPDGWHLPSDEEWATLETYVADSLFDGETNSAGYALKSTSGWNDDGDGSDAFGFEALPAGYRYGDGSFGKVLEFADFWSSTEDGTNSAYRRYLYDIDTGLGAGYGRKDAAYSVRCVKD